MRVAVTGANGRLGRALVAALGDAPFTGPAGPIAWTRADFDLDAPASIDALLDRDRPEVVVHAAAWTDVDGCARDPDLALRRNAEAVHVLAEATASARHRPGPDQHERGVRRTTRPRPRLPARRPDRAGQPVRAVEVRRARSRRPPPIARRQASLGDRPDGVAVRPARQRLPDEDPRRGRASRAAGEPLKVVGDEFGSPTFTHDVAEAIVEVLGSGDVAGVHHVVNAGVASRADWARELFRQVGIDVADRGGPGRDLAARLDAAAWGVLEPTPLPAGEPMRPWQQALADYLPAAPAAATAAHAR